MERTASSGLFHGFSRSIDFLKAPRSEKPVYEDNDVHFKKRKKSRKIKRCLLRKAFLKQQETQDKPEVPDEIISKCPQADEVKTELASTKATLFLGHSPAHDYDSGLSMAGSTPCSRASSPISCLKPRDCVAVDCEMVGTGPCGRISELARCSIVNYEGDTVYDKYIRPQLPVTDYRTRWSGITRKHMEKAIPFKMAQKEILNILKGKTVIGHALLNDFKALKYFHPKEQTRDTSELPQLYGMAGLPKKPHASLKRLASLILKKSIQSGRQGHSSVEDALTCMELYKLVEDAVEQDFQNGCVFDDSDHQTDGELECWDDQFCPLELTKICR